MPRGAEELLTAAPALVAGVLRRFGQARLRAAGGSMFPVIRSGDTLTIHSCTPAEVQHGDVVLLLEGDRLYAHRLVATPTVDGERWLVTRGDAHWHCDPPRPPSTLLGRVVAVRTGEAERREPFHASRADRLRGIAASELTRLLSGLRRPHI